MRAQTGGREGGEFNCFAKQGCQNKVPYYSSLFSSLREGRPLPGWAQCPPKRLASEQGLQSPPPPCLSRLSPTTGYVPHRPWALVLNLLQIFKTCQRRTLILICHHHFEIKPSTAKRRGEDWTEQPPGTKRALMVHSQLLLEASPAYTVEQSWACSCVGLTIRSSK